MRISQRTPWTNGLFELYREYCRVQRSGRRSSEWSVYSPVAEFASSNLANSPRSPRLHSKFRFTATSIRSSSALLLIPSWSFLIVFIRVIHLIPGHLSSWFRAGNRHAALYLNLVLHEKCQNSPRPIFDFDSKEKSCTGRRSSGLQDLFSAY